VVQNLTLTIDSELLKNVRKLAIDHDTSVNQMVRDFLGHLAREQNYEKASAAALRDFFRKNSVTIGATGGNKRWSREELYERR
jgi:hypothetical protein